MPETSKMTVAEEFCHWFVQHEAEMFDFDPNRETERERIFDQLTTELQKVDPTLTFELGPKKIRREFVISAGGIRTRFPP
jgi:hypothetical protein